MTARTGSRLAWVVFALVAACLVGGLVAITIVTTRAGTVAGGGLVEGGLFLTAMFSFAVVGVLIASRHPGNAIGWLLLTIGLLWELALGVGGTYVHWAFQVDPGSLPRPDIVAALGSSAWVPGIGLIGTFLLLLFPNGRLPSPRWRPLAWLCALVLLVLWVAIPLSPGSLRDLTGDPSLPRVPNPLGVEALRGFEGAFFAVLALLPLCMLGCAWSLIRRFRRSHGQERLQLKWLAAGAGVTAAIFLVSILGTLYVSSPWYSPPYPVWLTVLDQVSVYSFVLIPVAIGIAILRHRLYDIDVIINRALVYGALTLMLGAAYVLIVTVAGTLLRGSDVVTAAATLAVAALFRPLKRRIQGFIDRRFYRRKYDAVRTVEAFSTRLRDEVDLETMRADLVATVANTMQPTHASLWLRHR